MKLWTSLVNTGIAERRHSREVRHISFLNTIVLVIILMIIFNTVVAAFYFPHTLPVIPLFVGQILLSSVTLVWNRRHHYLAARIWLGLTTALCILLNSIALGAEAEIQWYAAAAVFLQFYIFPDTERPWMASVVLVFTLTFLGIEFLVPDQSIFATLPAAYVRAVTVSSILGFLFFAVGMGGIGFTVVSRTERKLVAERERSEKALRELSAAQARLIQQEKMASLGKLTAGIAHEIQNPLNFVNNFAGISRELAEELEQEVESGADADEIKAIAADLKSNTEMIERHGQRADGIVRGMMQHARGGSGKRVPVDLNAFVNEYVDLAHHSKRARVPELVVDIDRDLDPDVGTAEFVPQEIAKVLMNLLSNAFDATHDRAADADDEYNPLVTVSTRRVKGGVEIRVSDNGSGIPTAIQDRIFEPFFTTKPTGTGTGLGLSISYDIVTHGHGGALTVESTEGQGATFIVTLPVNHDAPPSTA